MPLVTMSRALSLCLNTHSLLTTSTQPSAQSSQPCGCLHVHQLNRLHDSPSFTILLHLRRIHSAAAWARRQRALRPSLLPRRWQYACLSSCFSDIISRSARHLHTFSSPFSYPLRCHAASSSWSRLTWPRMPSKMKMALQEVSRLKMGPCSSCGE